MGRRVSETGERGLIGLLREKFPQLQGIGDDCAVLDHLECPVVTTDSFFQGTHFYRWWAPAEILGRRLLEATISDIAAMGAQPKYILAAVSLDPSMEVDWLMDFYRGLLHRDGIPMAGGETVSGAGFGVTLTAIGEGGIPGTLMRRSALKPGDRLWISGRVGRALDAPGLIEAAGGFSGPELIPVSGKLSEEVLEQVRAFLKPEAEIELGMELRRNGVRCAIDISDGLFSEAAHLAAESGTDVTLHLSSSMFYNSVADRPLEASASGEDFVLLFAAGKELDFSHRGCIPVGWATSGGGTIQVFINDRKIDVTRTGYDHLEEDS